MNKFILVLGYPVKVTHAKYIPSHQVQHARKGMGNTPLLFPYPVLVQGSYQVHRNIPRHWWLSIRDL